MNFLQKAALAGAGAALTSGAALAQSAPVAPIKPKVFTNFGITRTDNYYWLNQPSSPEVLKYLNAENAYYDKQMAGAQATQQKLVAEIKGRIKQEDASVPYRDNGYYYYSRFDVGGEYPVYCRKKGSEIETEEVLLDANELGAGRPYFQIGDWAVSDNNQLLAYTADTVSRRLYTLRFKNLATGQLYPERIANTGGEVVWAADNKTVFYTKKDVTTLLPYQVYRHTLGTNPKGDALIYEEHDNTFRVGVSRTKSKKFIGIELSSSLSSEYRYLDAATPTGQFKTFLGREKNHLYNVEHLGDRFYVRTNWQAPNYRLMVTPVANTAKTAWQDALTRHPEIFLDNFELFRDFLVLNERKGGLRQLRVISLKDKQEHYLQFEEPAYTATIGINAEQDTPLLRYNYTSLTTPASTFEYDMSTRTSTLLKEQTVLGGFNKRDYVTERVFVKSRDNAFIPMSIVYKKGTKLDGSAPLLQYAYGSYGFSQDPTFSSARLSLLNRGFVYALCNIRGGQEMGRQWFEDGRMLHKKNSFNDFIDCSLYLTKPHEAEVAGAKTKQQYTAPDKLFAMGGSAGGLLMGAVMNMRPDLYKGVIVAVPFVDVVTTMSDPSIPLTTSEYDQWGNPADEEYFRYMLSYSPYDNVKAQAYPNTLVTTGLHDSQVQYFEPAKWVAKLRAMKTDKNQLLLHTDMSAGHGGASGRFKSIDDTARQYAFMLQLLGKNL
ncbi:S9 family peptidase [Hymenobacter sp. BT770]|uniref:S9 family peptidase n=1 Tax=Hymenobacter sp. BT770 TaxID=2886942 RepID=UPI001D0F9BCD|nr:S9 family peptidase [Hymenobacter sp. BT770]MCC3155276.1 S9 family peptidase [Hymenobacter sp. BT770]MDO3417259.1 S9 family peptidase [Hymenobacter sp. BT770]